MNAPDVALVIFACAVVVAVGGVGLGVFLVVVRQSAHARLARFYAGRAAALDDAGLVFVDDGKRLSWREKNDRVPAVDVGFDQALLSCRLPAPALGARVAAAWAKRGGALGVLPRSAGALLDDNDANACVGRLLDDGLAFSFDGSDLVVDVAPRDGDVEPQVVLLIARARALSAALTQAASSLAPLDERARAAALVET